ncbi:UDP-glucose/GDP-mannose dehydrogenase family protein [archaeon]|nr:UDP-glucose/GDP-mannose dehydrogenase family protein [archaeon]
MDVSVIGCGYVGLVTGPCLADLGHNVICMDSDKEKIGKLSKGVLPIFEPGLEGLVHTSVNEGRLDFTDSIERAVDGSEIIFICVGTPTNFDDTANLSAVEEVCNGIANSMKGYKLVVEKSTVPVETNLMLTKLIKEKTSIGFDIASNPEFLREGTAIKDFMNPDRIVIGTDSERAKSLLLKLYAPLKKAPIYPVDINTAEMIKHASNSFLAMKISFANLVSKLCERTNTDVEAVMAAVGADKRIGGEFFSAGVGYGGSCFPKDVKAFRRVFENYGIDASLLEDVEQINESQRGDFVIKVKKVCLGINEKVIGVLGLSFKPGTDDMRYAPSIDIISNLIKGGAKIKAYDPKAMENAKQVLPQGVQYCENPYETALGADALLILTEWREFADLDKLEIKKRLKKPVIIDGRNIYLLDVMEQLGFTYVSIGRKPVKIKLEK